VLWRKRAQIQRVLQSKRFCREAVVKIVGMATISAAAVMLAASSALADGFAADRFSPAPAGSDWFAQDSLDFGGTMRPSIGLELDWGHNLIRARSGLDGGVKLAILRNQTTARLNGSFVVADRLRFNLEVPFATFNSGQGNGGYLPAPSSAAFGDVRVTADALVFGLNGPLRAAVGVAVYLPSGSQGGYTSDGKVRVAPHLMGAGDLKNFSWAALAELQAGRDEAGNGAPVGTRIGLGLSAGYRLLDKALLIGPEVNGSAVLFQGARFHQGASSPVEANIGAHYSVNSDWKVGFAAGTALSSGVGGAVPHLIASLEWSPHPRPAESDGPAWTPAPDLPPELINGVPVLASPLRPLPGADDLPLLRVAPGDPMALALPPVSSLLINGMIIPDQHIEFDGETASLSKESEKPLQQVRQALFVNPQYLLAEIGVHTNYQGGDEKNLELSLKRADAIKTWLVNHGIDPARLNAEGYGNSRPLVLGLSEANMKKNRRVEVKVLTTKH